MRAWRWRVFAEDKAIRFNLGAFLQAASATAQGEIEGQLEAQQYQQQRQQHLAQQQMQQLQFLASQQEAQSGRRERALGEMGRVGPLLSKEDQPGFYEDYSKAYGNLAATPSPFGPDTFQGIGTPGFHLPSLSTPPNLFGGPAGGAAAVPPGGAVAAPPPAQPPPGAAPAPPAGLQMPAGLAGVGTTQPAPVVPAGQPAAAPGGPPIEGIAGQMLQQSGASPAMLLIVRAMQAQNAAKQAQAQTATAIGTAGAGSGAGGGTGPAASAVPGHLPGAGMVPPTPMAHPGGLLPPAPAPPPVTTTGLPSGVAPPAPEQPGVTLFGHQRHFATFDRADVMPAFNSFWALYKQSVNSDMPDEARKIVEGLAARNGAVPRTAADLQRMEADTAELWKQMAGRGAGQETLRLKQEQQWRKGLTEFDNPSADYLIGEAKAFRPEWGPNPIAGRRDFKEMQTAYEAGDTERAERLAEQVYRGLKSGLSEKDLTGRLGRLFELAGKAAPGTLDGHGWLRLAQGLGLRNMFTEADAPRMVGLLQGAAAEKERNLLLGDFKNWESLPPDAKDAVIARINGLGKIAGQKPINVPANFLRQLTPMQSRQLLQADTRIAIDGSREQVYAAHLKVMEGLTRERNARAGGAKTDQELAQDIRHEREAIQMFQGAMKLKDYQDAAVAYSQWKRENAKDPDALAAGPAVAKGIISGPKMRHLWGLEQDAKAASDVVTDRIQALSKQQQQPAPPQQRTTPPPVRRAAPAPAAAIVPGRAANGVPWQPTWTVPLMQGVAQSINDNSFIQRYGQLSPAAKAQARRMYQWHTGKTIQ